MAGFRQALRVTLPVVLLVGLVAPAAFGADGEPPGEQSPRRGGEYGLRIGATGVDRYVPVTHADDLLRTIQAHEDRADLAPQRDALRTFLAERWGVDVPAPDGEDLEDAEEPWTWRAAYPAGDLSGDGLADVLVLTETWPSVGASLEALSGADGSELWRLDGDSWEEVAAWPAGDLTGDGSIDLLSWTVSLDDWWVEESCLVGPCTYRDRIDFTWRVGVRSGRDGTQLWSQSYPGVDTLEIDWLEGLVVYDYEYRWDMTNALVLPYVSDGRLLLNRLDARAAGNGRGVDALAAWAGEREDALRVDSLAELVDPVTGAAQTVRQVEDAPSVGLLSPLAQDRAELVWSAFEVPDSAYRCLWTAVTGYSCDTEGDPVLFVVEVLDASLETVWQDSRPAPWLVFLLPLGRDLDGDGLPDLALLTLDDQWSFGLEVLAGGSGQLLWSRASEWWWPWPVPAGDLGGGTGEDVLLLGSEADVDGEEAVHTIVVERLAGATGATLHVTRHPVEPGDAEFAWGWAFPIGDLDGDGVLDVAVERFREWREDTGCDPWIDEDCGWDGWHTHANLLVEHGASGAPLYAASHDGWVDLWPAADLDGDGADEFFEVDWDAGEWTTAGLAGPLWSVDGWPWLMAAGDQTGDGASEVLVEHWHRLVSVDGPTGQHRWVIQFEDPDAGEPA